MRARLEALIDEMLDGRILLAEAVSEFERLYIKKALARNNKHLSKTALALGIHRNTISKRVGEYQKVKQPLARAARGGTR
jgi:DNA-binding NtrC family response regulator